MANNLEFNNGIDRLTQLSHEVDLSTQRVMGRLASWNGHLVLGISRKFSFIPDWAQEHIDLNHKLKAAVSDYTDRFDADMPEGVARALRDSNQALRKLASKLDLEKYFEFTRPKGAFVDPNCLIKQAASGDSTSVPHHTLSWYQNLALLARAYNTTEDLQLKKIIGFLAFNFLAKAAPICPGDVSVDSSTQRKLYQLFQLSLLEPGVSYNRETALFDAYFKEGIAGTLAAASGSLFYLTDSSQIQDLLPLWFHTAKTKRDASAEVWVKEWSTSISQKLEHHFRLFPDDPCAHYFSPPLLIDLTEALEPFIYTSKEHDKEVQFEERLRKVERCLETAVDEAVSLHSHDEESHKRLKALVIANLISICRCNVKGVGVLKVLPALCDSTLLEAGDSECSLLGVTQNSPQKLSHILLDLRASLSKGSIDDFLNGTGVRLGSVNGRQKVFDFISLEQFLEKAGGVPVVFAEEGPNSIYYKKPQDFLSSALFRRFENMFTPKNLKGAILIEDKPYITTLAKPTLALLKGVMREIGEERWEELNHHPACRQIIQAVLYKIAINLAQAEMHAHDFSKFSQAIELIHYEMATLLAISAPFEKEEFLPIYRGRLDDVIPKKLRKFVKAGLTKSGMNTFAGLSVALRKSSENPIRVFDPASHFEIVQFVGENYQYDNVLKNDSLQSVDLYLGEFNHNVRLLADHDEYEPGSIIKEVKTLLEAKPATKQLTVAVDSTIDFISSPRAREVLDHFSQDIIDGKLNIVFFRSGQKYDMFGMDNFYGAPWYMINNGDKKWDAFNILLSDEAFQTDHLSLQWFCLANKYTPRELDLYRKSIFDNAKEVLDHVPDILLPGGNPHIKVCKVADGMKTGFVDIKFYGKHAERGMQRLETFLYKIFTERNLKIHSRGGYGYFNPNINRFYGGLEKDKSLRYCTMRLHPGVNADENNMLIECLKEAANMVAEFQD